MKIAGVILAPDIAAVCDREIRRQQRRGDLVF